MMSVHCLVSSSGVSSLLSVVCCVLCLRFHLVINCLIGSVSGKAVSGLFVFLRVKGREILKVCCLIVVKGLK